MWISARAAAALLAMLAAAAAGELARRLPGLRGLYLAGRKPLACDLCLAAWLAAAAAAGIEIAAALALGAIPWADALAAASIDAAAATWPAWRLLRYGRIERARAAAAGGADESEKLADLGEEAAT